MNDQQIKQQLRQRIESRSKQIKVLALSAYEKRGRGHVMFVCKVPRNFRGHFKVNDTIYISQQQEAKNVALEPRSKDHILEEMVSEYDPSNEAVILAFWGHLYARVTLKLSHVLTDEDWAQVIIEEGTH